MSTTQQWELAVFTEEFGEKRIGLFNSKKNAVNEAKNQIYCIGSYDKTTFTYSNQGKVWTNDPTGMMNGSYWIRKVEVKN